MGPRAYLLCVTGLAGAVMGLVAALNVAMDPYNVGEEGRGRLRSPGWTQESDRMPDRGLSGRVAAAGRGQVDVVLTGTSRTMHGFGPGPRRLNAGLGNAAFDEQRIIGRAAAGAADPPDYILVEAPALLTVEPGRRRFLNGPTLAERLFSTVATETSLRLLAEPRAGPYEFTVTPGGEALRRDQSSLPFIAFGTVPVTAYLDEAIAELRGLCRAGGGWIVIYEPPMKPTMLEVPEVRAAVAARLEAYRRAIARMPAGPCRPAFHDLSGLDGRPLPAATDPANWYDNTHFMPVVGEEALRALLAGAT